MASVCGSQFLTLSLQLLFFSSGSFIIDCSFGMFSVSFYFSAFSGLVWMQIVFRYVCYLLIVFVIPWT